MNTSSPATSAPVTVVGLPVSTEAPTISGTPAIGGSFEATLPLPTGRLAPQTRYTAAVEGQRSSALELGRVGERREE
jgi:hypothetical protein